MIMTGRMMGWLLCRIPSTSSLLQYSSLAIALVLFRKSGLYSIASGFYVVNLINAVTSSYTRSTTNSNKKTALFTRPLTVVQIWPRTDHIPSNFKYTIIESVCELYRVQYMATAAWIPVKQLFVGLLAAENPFKNLLTLPSYSSRQPAPPSQYISVHNYSLCL